MREISSQGNVETEGLFDHVIEGLGDSASNKAVLYGAKNISKFKERLKTYEKIRKSSPKVNPQSIKKKEGVDEKNSEPTKIKGKRCFNCGLTGHVSNDCKNKEKGAKCFRCNKFGYIAPNCKEVKESSASNSQATVNFLSSETKNDCYKEISVENVNIKALVDTGSALSLLRKDALVDMRLIDWSGPKCKATAFGGGNVETYGSFQAEIVIDDEPYNLDLHVVPAESMPMKCLIGRNILPIAEVRADRKSVEIKKYPQDNFLANITVAEKIDIDVGPIDDGLACKEAEDLLLNYKSSRTKSTDITLNINLKENKPIFSRPRRLPIPGREIVDRQVDEWIKDGVVEPSSSEFASPVVVTKKKDGTPRVCIDYRRINRVIERDKYPIPLIEDQIDALKDSRIFSTLDLRNGFFHVSVNEESRKYTSFVTHKGQFVFLRTPFGLCISPSIFQRFINCVFRPLDNKGIV